MLIRVAALSRDHARSWEPAPPPPGTVVGAHRLKLVLLCTSERRSGEYDILVRVGLRDVHP